LLRGWDGPVEDDAPRYLERTELRREVLPGAPAADWMKLVGKERSPEDCTSSDSKSAPIRPQWKN
jgi:hypothetical protein